MNTPRRSPPRRGTARPSVAVAEDELDGAPRCPPALCEETEADAERALAAALATYETRLDESGDARSGA